MTVLFPSQFQAFRLSVTALLNSFDILNVGTSFSPTITFSPVLGLRAWRRFLCRILNEPNPLISMRFIVFSESMMLSKSVLTTDSLSLSVKPVFWATVPIRSAFVVVVFMVWWFSWAFVINVRAFLCFSVPCYYCYQPALCIMQAAESFSSLLQEAPAASERCGSGSKSGWQGVFIEVRV